MRLPQPSSSLAFLLVVCALPGAQAAPIDPDRDARVVQGLAVAQRADAAPPAAPQAHGVGTAKDDSPFDSPALDGGALDALRGGDQHTQVWTHNEGQVDGNSANGVVSGNNVLDGGAFANAAGINTVIQNSGSNVLIQNGTAVNVQFVNPQP